MPQARGPDGLGFVKAEVRRLLDGIVDTSALRVGSVPGADFAAALLSAISEAAVKFATMPANFTRLPNSGLRVFMAYRRRPARDADLAFDLQRLRGWGELVVPGNLWRALSRFGA